MPLKARAGKAGCAGQVVVAVSPEVRPFSLGGRESSELTASDGNGDGKMSKAANLCRSLGVGDK